MKNLSPQNSSPFNSVVEYQRFASSIVYADHQIPVASFSPCGRFISYKDKTLEVAQWTSGLRQLFEDTKAAMDNLFHHTPVTLSIPDIVQDDMTEQRRGYSWLDNGTFVQDRVLMQILMNDADLNICIKSPGGLIFNRAAMMKVMGQMAKININLSILCHELPGQPARASEFVEHKIRNSIRGRTFFRHHGADWLVTRRLKTEYKNHRESFLPSKIPPELQELLDFYLLCV